MPCPPVTARTSLSIRTSYVPRGREAGRRGDGDARRAGSGRRRARRRLRVHLVVGGVVDPERRDRAALERARRRCWSTSGTRCSRPRGSTRSSVPMPPKPWSKFVNSFRAWLCQGKYHSPQMFCETVPVGSVPLVAEVRAAAVVGVAVLEDHVAGSSAASPGTGWWSGSSCRCRPSAGGSPRSDRSRSSRRSARSWRPSRPSCAICVVWLPCGWNGWLSRPTLIIRTSGGLGARRRVRLDPDERARTAGSAAVRFRCPGPCPGTPGR